jgi:hypothetical protein
MLEVTPNISFADTRARSTDGQTSRDAAKHAATQKAAYARTRILFTLRMYGPLTAREIAAHTRIDYFEVQRRISETAGIAKTTERRGGGFVWKAI